MAQLERPIIGLNMDVIGASKVTRPHLRLNTGYFDAVSAGGGFPILMPPYGKEKEIQEFLDRIDGFVLTGGLDMDPRRQGLPTHPKAQPMTERREENDRLLIRLLRQRRIPVLAIGVGMHQLNVLAGGSLIQHLPEEMPRAMPHFDASCSGPHRHLVLLEPGTQMEEIYGECELLVNSNHHQAVRQVGQGFRICAKAPDGVIEAIESTDPSWFAIGVQWHPEAESASALDLQLFECFLRACTSQNAKLSLAA